MRVKHGIFWDRILVSENRFFKRFFTNILYELCKIKVLLGFDFLFHPTFYL